MAIGQGNISYYQPFADGATGNEHEIAVVDSGTFILGIKDNASLFYEAVSTCTVSNAWTNDITLGMRYSGSRIVVNRNQNVPRMRPFKLKNSWALIYTDSTDGNGLSVFAISQSAGVWSFPSRASTTNGALAITWTNRSDHAVVNDNQIAVFGYSAGSVSSPQYYNSGSRMYVFTVTGSSAICVEADGVGGPKQTATQSPGNPQWLGASSTRGMGLCCVSQSNVSASLVGSWYENNVLNAQVYTWSSASATGLNQTGFGTGSIGTLSTSQPAVDNWVNANPALACVGENLFMWSYITSNSLNDGQLELGIGRVDPATKTFVAVQSQSVDGMRVCSNRLAVMSIDTGSNYSTVLSWATSGSQANVTFSPWQQVALMRVSNITPATSGSVTMSFDIPAAMVNVGMTWAPTAPAALTSTKFVVAGYNSSGGGNDYPVQVFDLYQLPYPGFTITNLQSLVGVTSIKI